jgi:hypothetical protein
MFHSVIHDYYSERLFLTFGGKTRLNAIATLYASMIACLQALQYKGSNSYRLYKRELRGILIDLKQNWEKKKCKVNMHKKQIKNRSVNIRFSSNLCANY